MSDHTKVGEILNSDQPRDAIHIAVASVIATEKLLPGASIGFVEGGTHNHNVDVAACEHAMSVGIVDPFLRQPVLTGQRFWMFLHPNTITSLRHNWTHPAFGKGEEEETPNSASVKWMMDFSSNYAIPYKDMIEAGKNWIKHGDNFSDGGTFEGESVPEEYWDHFQKITGIKVQDHDRHSFFTCSC